MPEIPLSAIHARARERPPGYVEDVLAAGELDGDVLRIDDGPYMELIERYQLWDLDQPSIGDMLVDFAQATARFVAAGCPIVTPDQFRAVLDTCETCRDPDGRPRWDPQGNLGLGRCSACGCTSMKLHWATVACPLGRWRNPLAPPLQGP